jgi:hypothetical protein
MVITSGALMGLTRWLDVRPGTNRLVALRHIMLDLNLLGRPRGKANRPRIAYLGDSSVMSFSQNSRRLPARLQAQLRSDSVPGSSMKRLPVRVYDLSFPATGTFGWYFLADAVAASEPDLVIWQVSFTHLSPNWRRRLLLAELSCCMDTRRAGEVLSLPLYYAGLTLDRFLLYQAIDGLGGLNTWYQVIDEQSRINRVRATWLAERWRTDAAVRYVQASGFAMKRARGRPRRSDRYNEAAELVHYGDALTGLDPMHPVLQVLAAGLRVYRDAGIPVIVYLNPINVENLEAVDAYDRAIVEHSVELYRAAVESNGALFLDYHSLFPDSYFKDAPGHFTEPPSEDAGGLLVERMAPHVTMRLFETRKRRP